MTHTLHLGDCRDVLATMGDATVDAIVCDPPYELGFMGKAWDASGIAYDVTVWAQCLRVLKPGGHGNAGVKGEVEEVRTSINITAPSTDLAKQWHGWGTALKPAHEPAVLARKPLRGTVADTVAQWGTGALNIDGTRVGSDERLNKPVGNLVSIGSTRNHSNGEPHTVAGRWPSNVILDEEAASLLGEPSRFFYVAKASKAEREAGLDGVATVEKPNGNKWTDQDYRTGRIAIRANHHPTVKPLALMRYLVRMVTPPGGVVLDPFMGSGSTGCAAVREGFDFVGIDLTPEYVAIAQKRIDWHAVTSPLDNVATMELQEENEA